MQQPEPGTRFANRYDLEAVLGRGGFATVFRARDSVVGRTVAVKILAPAGDGYPPQLVARFEREGQALAGLRDPHTIHLYEIGRAPDGLLFMVFEFIDGQDLSDLIGPQGSFDERATRHVLRQVLASLREAHHAGLLHRDIKPANIRVYEYMGDPLCVKLMDFGIARGAGPSDGAVTRQGEVVGTPRYMPLEQMSGAQLSPATDIYSLGIVAYEMLMGTAANPLDAITRGAPLAIDASPEFAAVINRMVRRDPEHRFPSAEAVLSALDQPVTPARRLEAAPQPSAPGAAPTANTRLLAVLAGLLTLVLVAGLIAGTMLTRTEEAPAVTHRRAVPAALLTPSPAVAVPAPSNTNGSAVDAGAPDAPSLPAGGSAGCGRDPIVRDLFGTPPWLTILPPTYDKWRPYPLLLVFGAFGAAADATAQNMDLAAFAQREGVIVAVVEGKLWVDDERPLIGRMIRDLRRDYCVEEARVFALGHGTGGIAATLASCAPEVDAFATTTHRAATDAAPCLDPHPIPHIHFTPLRSRYLPVKGGESCAVIFGITVRMLSVQDHEALWRGVNGCGTKKRTRLKHHGSTCYEWDCEVPLVSCHLDGGGPWHERELDLDANGCDAKPADFPRLETIWQFFEEVTEP